MDLFWDAQNPNGVALFEQVCHKIRVNGPNSQPQSFYTEPVTVSAGRDGKMDLDSWMTPTGNGASDNLYSYKQR